MGDGIDGASNPQIPNRGNIDGALTDILEVKPSVWSANMCADFIRSRAGSPWFAQYCPTIPHSPYYPTKASKHRYDGVRRRVSSVNEGDMSDKPKWMRSLPKQGNYSIQTAFEGKKEELVDLDHLGVRPILAALVHDQATSCGTVRCS